MDINSLINKVKTQGPDQSQASSGGGDYTPPPAGPTGARLVGYYEVGKHAGEYQGTPKVNDTVKLVFELIGAKHPVREVDGQKVPTRITLTMNLSTNEKSGFFKMFSRIREEGMKNMIEMLGKPVLLNIVHRKVNEGKPNERTYANIDKESVRKPVMQQMNPDTGDIEEQPYPVGPAVSELKAFVWDFATPEMWDAIYIPGQYEERKDDKGNVTAPAKSKNVLQEEIASALNFKGLPCYDYAAKKITKDDSAALDAAVGEVDEAPAAEPKADNGPDPLEGIA